MSKDGILPPRRLPVGSFEKMVVDLVQKGDVRETKSKTGRVRYSVLYANGKDYSLFEWCREFLTKNKKLHFKSAGDVADFARWMRETGRSERTLQMCVRLIEKVYGLATTRGIYPINPVAEAKKNQVVMARIKKQVQARRNPAMRCEISHDEKVRITEVVKAHRDPRAVWIGLNVWMGLRPSVFNKIRFEDFDLQAGVLRIRPEIHKSRLYKESGQPTASFLPPEVYPLLDNYLIRIGLRPGFKDTSGKPVEGLFLQRPIGYSAMRRQWRRMLEKAGIKEYVAPYAARFTMINEMLSAGVHLKDVATHAGNTPETIYKYYVKPSKEEEIRGIPDKLKEHRERKIDYTTIIQAKVGGVSV
ncbi:tyrosine-type recombinase/integrase [bacterium]|nr:tyrosine-type recombinase/integrase [bacterium]